MLTNNAIPSYGTLIKMSDAGGANHATIGYVRDIAGGGFKVNTQNTTTHDGTGPWMRKTATLIEGNQLKFTVNFHRSDVSHNEQAGLIAVALSRERRNFKMVYTEDAGGNTDSFDGFLTQFDVKAPVDGVYTADVTIEPDGEITYGG